MLQVPHPGGAVESPEGPWNPGLNSSFTRELLARATIFLPENTFRDVGEAYELHGVTRIPVEDLAVFRPDRLALHEILVRVTADYEIPDPETASIGSLGVTLRQMAGTICSQVLEPCRSEIELLYDRLKEELESFIELQISTSLAASPEPPSPEPKPRRSLWSPFRKQARIADVRVQETVWDRDERAIRYWTEQALSSEVPSHAAAFRALVRAASAVRSQHGRILGERTFLRSVAAGLACNEYAARMVGGFLKPRIREAAREAGFRRLPAQTRAVAMVTKGAPASGKSTMRPLQRKLAARMGIHWGDFALISPDTWRRALLDFNSLGPLYKYAGMLTSHEVAVIDRKLDARLVRKGESHRTTHILVDRFRFDSFALDSDECKHLPSRFKDLLCYLFMITPPEKTVERAWQRGLEIGRYKALDDLLAHNVEAYTGLQNILFGRSLDPKVSIHYELLDNDVPRGELPYTVAFGWSGEMNVLDPARMITIERYRKLNVDATGPEALYAEVSAGAKQGSLGFLARCIQKFPRLNLVDRQTTRIYAKFKSGRLLWVDPEAIDGMHLDEEARDVLFSVAPEMSRGSRRSAVSPEYLRPERNLTIGRWGQNGLTCPVPGWTASSPMEEPAC